MKENNDRERFLFIFFTRRVPWNNIVRSSSKEGNGLSRDISIIEWRRSTMGPVTHACTREIYAYIFSFSLLALPAAHTRQVRQAGKAWTGCCICMPRLIWMHRCILNGPAAIWSLIFLSAAKGPRSEALLRASSARKRSLFESLIIAHFPSFINAPLLPTVEERELDASWKFRYLLLSETSPLNFEISLSRTRRKARMRSK